MIRRAKCKIVKKKPILKVPRQKLSKEAVMQRDLDNLVTSKLLLHNKIDKLVKRKLEVEKEIEEIERKLDEDEKTKEENLPQLKQIDSLIESKELELQKLNEYYNTMLEGESEIAVRIAAKQKQREALLKRNARYVSCHSCLMFAKAKEGTVAEEQLSAEQDEHLCELHLQIRNVENLIKCNDEDMLLVYKELMSMLDCETQERKRLGSLEEVMADNDKYFMDAASRDLIQGWNSINVVVRYIRNKNDDLAHAYHGAVLDLIECDAELYPYVEMINTNSNILLGQVVDNLDVAAKFIAVLEELNLPGKVMFIDLSSASADTLKMLQERDITPLYKMLRYDMRYHWLMVALFSRVVVCKTGKEALRMATMNSRLICFACPKTNTDAVRSYVRNRSLFYLRNERNRLIGFVEKTTNSLQIISDEILRLSCCMRWLEGDTSRLLTERKELRKKVKHSNKVSHLYKKSVIEFNDFLQDNELKNLTSETHTFPFDVNRDVHMLDEEIESLQSTLQQSAARNSKLLAKIRRLEKKLNNVLKKQRDSLLASRIHTREKYKHSLDKLNNTHSDIVKNIHDTKDKYKNFVTEIVCLQKKLSAK